MAFVTDLPSHEKNRTRGLIFSSAFWLAFWRAVSLLAILHLALFDLLLLAAPEMIRVQFTPDDGYYYLTLARNFVRFGEWTFDGGVSLTSGFHLVQAYLLATVYNLFQPGPEDFVRLGTGIGSILTILVVLLAWRMCLRTGEVLFLIAFTLLVTAKSFLFNSVSITEWPIVILIAGLYCAYFWKERLGPANLWIPFALGLLGSLARSDFGLLPFSIFAAAFLVARSTGKNAPILETFAGLVGSVLGIGFIFLHNFLTTGVFLQSSALMKSHWAQFVSQKFYGAATLGLQILGMDLGFMDYSRSIFLLTFLLISGPLALILLAGKSGQNHLPPAVFRLDPQRPLHERILVLAAALCLAGYTFVYTRSGVVQNWYTANLTWPVFILVVAGARYLQRRILREYQFTVIWLSVFTLVSLGVQVSSLYPLGDRTSPWPHQQFMLEAGRYLAKHPAGGRVGSWNSGIPGYYQGGTGVINIDGLVNNDIYPYAVQNDLPAYLESVDIRYLLDYENMFHPPFTRRGGYDDADFLERLTTVREFGHNDYIEFKVLRLVRIDP